MATEAVVSSLLVKLQDLITQESNRLHGTHDDINWIRNELERLQDFLKDADSRQKVDASVREWVERVREVCYDVEDFVNSYISNQVPQERRRGLIVSFKQLKIRHQASKEIHRIKLMIDDISNGVKLYDLKPIPAIKGVNPDSLKARRRRSAVLEESEIVGKLDEIETLKKRLMDEEPRRCVISVVGMGGSGKTTLAKKVYHDVENDFDCRAFICLSGQYRMKDVMIRLLTQFGMEKEKLNGEEEELRMMLCAHMKDKSYLVVVDDIWSTEAWDMLNCTLPDSKNKSRVMLTTRIKDVALHADPLSHPHTMRLLSNDEGWELFMKKIFPEGNPSTACPAELVDIGRRILEKCEGVPLAILVLGGLLGSKEKTPSVWSGVLQSVNWHLDDRFVECPKVFTLSYLDMPHYLKPCFLYLGIFPEDYEFRSGRLIRLWIAEGFIQQRDNSIIEDIAEDYLEELVYRGMIQATSRRSNGSIKTCRIHDLLRDLSLAEATEDNFFTSLSEIGTVPSLTTVRRLAVNCNIHGDETINRLPQTIRSILCFPGSKVHLSKLLKACGKLLGVLVADGAEETLPDEIGLFVHLRYLELVNIIVGSLPSSIGNLSNLQTLKLSLHGTLPSTIWNLKQLRHLSAYHCDIDAHQELNELSDLQTLCLRAGSWIKDDLDKLSNLRKLRIHGDLMSHEKALSDSIGKLSNLQSLKLYAECSIPKFMPFTHQHLYKMYLDGRMDNLPELPPSLTELSLMNSKLEEDAIPMLRDLPHLGTLRFLPESYISKKMICSSGGFPELKLLVLRELPLEEWIVEEGAMKSLKSVKLFFMKDLKKLPEKVCSLLKRN